MRACKRIEFKKFLEDFARDFSSMVSSESSPERILVEGIAVNLPAATAIPLGFIASELITNAAKYGKSRMRHRPAAKSGAWLRAFVSNDGPVLPEGFSPRRQQRTGDEDHSIVCEANRR